MSSGAIAAGLGAARAARAGRATSPPSRPRPASARACSSHRYTAAFARHGLTVGQVLLTADDVVRRAHYRNAQRTLDRLLGLGVVPVVNENDTVATDEIRFGDNDRLAALVAHLVARRRAGAAVRRRRRSTTATRAGRAPGGSPTCAAPADLAGVDVGGVGAAGVGTGGMAPRSRPPGSPPRPASRSLLTVGRAGRRGAGRASDVGTCFHPDRPAAGAPGCSGCAHADHRRAAGCTWTPGAVEAVVGRRHVAAARRRHRGRGRVRRRRPGRPARPVGRVVARGLVDFDAAEMPELLGRSTRELAAELGPEYEREVVHRDDIVLLEIARH